LSASAHRGRPGGFAKLAGGVALGFQHGRHGHIRFLPAFLCTWNANFGHAGAHRDIAAVKCCSAGGAALLSIVIREGQPFPGLMIECIL